MPYFVENIEEIRERARQKIDEGPVTGSYDLDKDRVLALLNDALATEIVCVLRYMHHYFMATGVHGRAVAGEFKQHADDEREHADTIAERIQQLGGKPDLNPGTLVQRSVAQYVEGETLADMIREDLIAERVVIDVYREMIRFFGEKDSTSRIMMEDILAKEEEHANDLADFLYIVDPRSGQVEGQDPGTHPLAVHPESQGRVGSRGSEAQSSQLGAARQQVAPQADTATPPGGRAGAGGRGQASRPASEGQEPVEPVERLAGEQQPEMTSTAGRTGVSSDGERRATRRLEQKRQGIRGEARPARASGQERPETRGPAMPHTSEPVPLTRKRPRIEEPIAPAEEDLRGHEGASRSVHVTNPTRKRKRVA